MKIRDLFVESKRCPLGIDAKQPVFSWSFEETTAPSKMQTAYRILVSESAKRLEAGEGDVWDSGKTAGRKNVHIPYEGKPLASRKRYYWKVQIWDEVGNMQESPVSWWEMGLLAPDDWKADWIGEPAGEESGSKALPIFRHEFALDRPVRQARAYVTGLGHYELRLNGRKIGEDVLQPGWTHYDKTVFYNVYDITAYVQQGANAVGVLLGNGFFNVTGGRYKKFTGSFGPIRCLVQLEIILDDGSMITVASGEHWRTAKGPIEFACIYGGEDYNALAEMPGWDMPGFAEDGRWRPAVRLAAPKGKLVAQLNPPLKVMQTFRPIRFTEPEPGVYVADLGQNFSGWVQIKVKGPKGATVTLAPSELLKDTGKANQKWTGSPYRFNYTLKGEGEEVWAPRFSYYGFRYVQIEGAVPQDCLKGEPDDRTVVLLELEGQMIYPDIETVGTLETSDRLINQIHHIIDMAILSNMKSYFTDCPHREKLGWLEQLHLMGPSVMYNYQVESLFEKVMNDMRDAQLPNGMVPTTAPEYVVFDDNLKMFRDSISWGASYILVGWNMFKAYGNQRILAEHYDGMKKYLEYMKNCSDHYIVSHGLGDWYDVGEKGPGFAQNTPVALPETAMFYHIATVMEQIARLLKKKDDAAEFAELAGRIKQAFNDAFFDKETMNYGSGSQTSNAMPLALGLVDEPYREAVFAKLVDDIIARGCHTTAGDVGHRYVLLALRMFGRSDLIYAMTRKTDYPSYGYQIEHGATTLTEAWDGPTVGKSQNHFMLGHIEEWFYSGLAGIDYAFDHSDGLFKVVVKPEIPDGMQELKASHRLPVGTVRVEWHRIDERRIRLEVVVPSNVLAVLYVPAVSLDGLQQDGQPVCEVPGARFTRMENGYAVFTADPGQYRFECVFR